MTDYELKYTPYGAHSILVEWPHEINPSILQDIISFKNKLNANHHELIVKIISAYNSILIGYEFEKFNYPTEVKTLKELYLDRKSDTNPNRYRWHIPVCYDVEYGLDLELIAATNKLSVQDIVKIHTETTYTVYFIGFLPGFLYLGGLDHRLAIPRKVQPRSRITKGAVAIGGSQTGIYPSESPGGWQIIGNSPLDFFDPKRNPPCFTHPGDEVIFIPITQQEHESIKERSEKGVFQVESEVIDD